MLEIRKGLKSYLIADTFCKIKNLLCRRFFCLGIFYFPIYMLCSISTTTLIPSLQHISVDQIRCTLVHNLNLFHLLLFNSIFPQLPINKSLSFLRGFYWYLTIIEGRVFPSLYLAVRYYSGKLLPDYS